MITLRSSASHLFIVLAACLACAGTTLAQGDPCPDPCNPACPDYNECDCIGDPCDPSCGGDPCDPACGGDPCDPACGGDPCNPECGGGDPCDPACGGDPCDPSCPDYDPCECEIDPCDTSCPDYEPCLYPECPDYDECYCFGGPLSCNPLCDEYDPYCSGECPEYDPCLCPDADPCECGFGDPCECGTDPCDPTCGGTPECDPDCGGDPCDPFCGGDPCDPDGGCYDPCDTNCPDYEACDCDPASCAPANDDCDAYLALTEGVTVFDTTFATSGVPFGDFVGCQNDGNQDVFNDIWFKYQASCTGILRLTTCGGTYWDTRIAVYDAPCGSDASLIACNDDGEESACTLGTSLLEVDVQAGSAYFIRLGGASEGSGDVGRLFADCTASPNDCDDPLPECPTDLDDSGTTDVTDLLAVLAAWNQTGPPRPEGDCAPAATGDCTVNVLDLLAVLNAWGLCSDPCDDPCNPACPDYNECDCIGDPCDPACGGDPCDPACGGDPCDPACGGDPCDPACGGGDPCDPECGGDPCYPECGGDPCDPACGGDPCDPSCGGDPCDPSCTPDPCSDPSSECYDECECTYCLYPDCPDYDECYCYGGPLECNPLCPDYNPYCNPACAEYDPCNPWADCYDPCECGDPCDPECGGDPCDPECGGDPCDPACGGDPCDPACGGDPCDPACGGDCGDDEGACCAFDTCNQLTQKTCTLLGGTFYGAGTFCADITCVTCDANELIDCNGNCFPANWVNDGYCDDGTYVYEGNPIDLTCETYNCDGGDCPAESCP